MSVPYWRLRELEEKAKDYRAIEEVRSLEYPNESASWVARIAEPRPRLRRRSRIRRILGWVGLRDGVPAPRAGP